MNQASQSAGAIAPQALPLKRKRGRPRKDHSITRFQSIHTPPGFGSRGNQSHRVDKIDDANAGMVGQPVTGVIEGAFDAGYLLTVRIGNSNTNFRGVVFKPGNYSPITAENDVAPHVQMIKRNEFRFPVENQSNTWSRERNGSSNVNQVQAFVPQSVNTVAKKGKHSALATVPCASMGSRGTVVPVILQPVNLVNGSPPTNEAPADSSAFRDKDVVNAEPLAMLPPAGMSSAQFLMCRNQQKASPVPTSHHQVTTARSPQKENGSCNEDRHKIGERNGAKDKKFTSVNETGEPSTGTQGSSESLENSKSSTENSQMDLENEICNNNNNNNNNRTPYTPKPLKDYGTGRMTELLQALQENMDMHVAHSEGRVDTDSKAAENKGSSCKP